MFSPTRHSAPPLVRAATVALSAALIAAALPACAQLASPSYAQSGSAPPMPGQTQPSYADLTDLVIAAPVIADVTIRSTARIKPEEAPGLQPGFIRYYITADVATLVRGAQGVPPRIGYLLDIAPDATGREPRLKKQRVLIFARLVPGTPDQLQLVAPDAQLAWTPEIEARVHAIGEAVVATDAPPRITGVGNAFHVPGALPGEGETQVFLTTANGAPVSLSILRRPGERPRWAVALSEIVDDAARPPEPDTLLWYRLACGLPSALPAMATAALEPDDARAATEDYAFVLGQLGSCGRTRTLS